MAHLVDGLQLFYCGGHVTIYDGEGKPIIYDAAIVDKNILEEFIWLYKQRVEHYKGDWRGMFADDMSYKLSLNTKKL